MHLFYKKNTEKHTVYSILGFQLKIKKDSSPYSIYKAIHQQWRLNGFSDELYNELNIINKSLYNWKKLDSRIWVIYLSCLIEKKSKETHDILKKYIFFHNKRNIHKCLPVANFAYINGIKNNQIITSVKIYNELEKNRQNRELEKLIYGKSIAIVGNGPSEIGKGKGKEIDEHDIVIRFNNFAIKGYENDYGTKTDIWCCNLNRDINRRKNNFKMVLLPEEITHKFINNIEIFSDALDYNSIIYCFGPEELADLDKNFYEQPTFGLRLIYGLSKILPSFNNLDFYGFNFCKDIQDTYTTHYFKQRNREYEQLHNLSEETKYLVDLISEMKNNKKIGFNT